MRQKWPHIALAILVLAQPVASAGAWASMMASMLDAAVEAPDHHNMNGVYCGMDCGTASSVVSQPVILPAPVGHGIYAAAVIYASPQHPPASLYKPPRTS